jgi:hypothetical protein
MGYPGQVATAPSQFWKDIKQVLMASLKFIRNTFFLIY